MTPEKPYEAFHPQFDRENFEKMDEWLDGEGSYVREHEVGLVFHRARGA